MKLSVDREHIKKVAEKYGMKVTFDSDKSGVLFPNGELVSFKEAATEALKDIGINLEEEN